MKVWFAAIAEYLEPIKSVLNFKIYELHGTPITVFSLVVFVLVFIAFYIFSRIFVKYLLKKLLTRFVEERGMRYNLVRVTHYIVMIIGAGMAFQFVGIDLSGLAVIFGLLSVGIGFGLQNVTSNFISGLILLFERPIEVGDRITVGGTEGDVKAINMRSTTIQTLDNISIIVPNSEFVSSQVVNWSHGDPKVRLVVEVGVSYGSDIDRVIKALKEVAEEHIDVLANPKPDILLREFGDSSWNMQLRIWLASTRRYYTIKSEINIAIVRKFREYDIEIPFPQRDLHVRSPLPLPLQQSEFDEVEEQKGEIEDIEGKSDNDND